LILRTSGYNREAYDLINKAIDLGITYLESARAYSGSESYYGKALRERGKEIFLASKSRARDKRGAFQHLRETLKNMETDHRKQCVCEIVEHRSRHCNVLYVSRPLPDYMGIWRAGLPGNKPEQIAIKFRGHYLT
jgi:aryl-alcohol dehydrogenase-like predicted oxidoreductase